MMTPADSRVQEPAELYQQRLPAKHRRRAPTSETRDHGTFAHSQTVIERIFAGGVAAADRQRLVGAVATNVYGFDT